MHIRARLWCGLARRMRVRWASACLRVNVTQTKKTQLKHGINADVLLCVACVPVGSEGRERRQQNSSYLLFGINKLNIFFVLLCQCTYQYSDEDPGKVGYSSTTCFVRCIPVFFFYPGRLYSDNFRSSRYSIQSKPCHIRHMP